MRSNKREKIIFCAALSKDLRSKILCSKAFTKQSFLWGILLLRFAYAARFALLTKQAFLKLVQSSALQDKTEFCKEGFIRPCRKDLLRKTPFCARTQGDLHGLSLRKDSTVHRRRSPKYIQKENKRRMSQNDSEGHSIDQIKIDKKGIIRRMKHDGMGSMWHKEESEGERE